MGTSGFWTFTQEATAMKHAPRLDLILLMLGIGPQGNIVDGLGGITRLQKLLFLLQEEQAISPPENAFRFSAYKVGPYSSKLYDDLEFLENVGLIRSQVSAEATEEYEVEEVDVFIFGELMGDDAEATSGTETCDGARASDAYEERKYVITQEGKKHIQQLLNEDRYAPIVDGIRKAKSKYGNYSLSDLLYYVYTRYPEMTTESEIRDKVLRRRRKP